MKSLLYVLLTVMVTAVSFAGGQGEAGPDDDVVELRFAWWGNAPRHEKHEQIATLFEQQNPGIRIIREPSSWGDYWTKLATQSSAGNPPDIITMHLNESARYTRDGILTDLQPFVDQGIIDLSNWSDGAIETGRDLGMLTRLSEGENSPSVWVNADLVEEYGLEMPDYEMSWDEWKEYFIENQMLLPEGVWMTKDLSYTFIDVGFPVWLRQRVGRYFVNEDDTGLSFDEADLVAWLEYWSDLRQAGAVMPPEVFAEFDGVPREQNYVITERVIVEFENSNQIVPTQELMDSTLQLHRMPTMPDGMNTYGDWTSGAYISVSAMTDYPEEAARFANFFVNNWEAQDVFDAEHGRPANDEIAARIAERSTPLQREFFDLTANVLNTAPPRLPYSQYRGEIVSAVTLAGEQVAFGDLTIEEAADRFFSGVDSIFP